jgi:hypothetical protein
LICATVIRSAWLLAFFAWNLYVAHSRLKPDQPEKTALSPVLKRVKAVYYTAFGGTNAIPLPAKNGTNMLNNQRSQ